MTPNEINKAIAEILVWSDLRLDEYWEENELSDGFIETWRGTSPNGQRDEWLPRWSHDLNKTVQLPVYEEHQWIISPKSQQVGIDSKGGCVYVFAGPSYALAAAKAWLDYAEREKYWLEDYLLRQTGNG